MTRYRTIVADPPWPLQWSMPKFRNGGKWKPGRYEIKKRELGYETMPVDAIAALSVEAIAERDAHLFLWVPDQFLIDGSAKLVAEAWGFSPGRLIVWHKPQWGLGTFPRPQHESLLVCKRGSLPFTVNNAGSVQRWPTPRLNGGNRGKSHSAKPDAALDLIEQASPGPYVELFARRARFGWDYWGDQSLETATLHKPAFDEDRG